MVKKIIFTVTLIIHTPTYNACAHAPPRNTIKQIVWDAGSTLTIVDRWGIAQEMGPRTILGMLLRIGHPTTIQKILFEVLEEYAGKQTPPCQEHLLTRDNNDLPLPHFMSDTWLCSRVSNKQLLDHINKAVDQWHPAERPASLKQRKIIKKVLRTALSAKVIGKHTSCAPEALELVKQCHNLGYTQYILSNFEREAFDRACRNPKNKELLCYVPRENIVISGECGMIKPYRCIYEYFLEKYGLKPEECLLIDDRWENVKAARRHGMYAITLKEGDYARLARKLKRWGIIPH